jgi:ABC-type branched-subunit amino acid transport system substrate-binding protein
VIRRLLAPRLALTGCACATLAVLAGCTTRSSSGTSVSGTTLAIYVSVPPGTLSPEARDVLSAEQLAFRQASGQVAGYTLKLRLVNKYERSENARTAISDPKTIAYLGEIAPGTSADSIGITNAEDMLQVSPTDTAVELTRSTPAVPGSPDLYYESLSTYSRTFARVVPTDAVETQAVLTEMRTLGVKHLYVASDGSAYGAALRYALLSRAGSAIPVSASLAGADAVFYAGSSASGADTIFNQAVSANPKVALFASSALAQDSFAASLSSAAQRNLYVSSPGFTASSLPPQGQQFVSSFRAAYRHAPATAAIFGYAAMTAVIHALQSAGPSAGSRSTVVHDFFAIRNLSSVLGTISIDKNGDVSGVPLVLEQVRAGKLVPTIQVQAHG